MLVQSLSNKKNLNYYSHIVGFLTLLVDFIDNLHRLVVGFTRELSFHGVDSLQLSRKVLPVCSSADKWFKVIQINYCDFMPLVSLHQNLTEVVIASISENAIQRNLVFSLLRVFLLLCYILLWIRIFLLNWVHIACIAFSTLGILLIWTFKKVVVIIVITY